MSFLRICRSLVTVIFTLILVSCVTPSPTGGVIVLKVEPNSPHKYNFTSGDRILEVSQHPVSTKAEIDVLVKMAHRQGKDSVLLLLNNRFGLRFLAANISQGFAGVTFADRLKKPAISK
jgi:S1-C subfamily serine protease